MKAKSTSSRRGTYSQEEIEFMEAIDRYQREKKRPFPTWSEVLEVLHSLGYTRKGRPSETAKDVKRWQELCNALRQERDQLHLELAKVKAERDQYLKAVYALTWEKDIEVPDKETLLAQIGKGPSLEDLLAELESSRGK
jgi:uncharacterized coiled-coil DUF342 family protein